MSLVASDRRSMPKRAAPDYDPRLMAARALSFINVAELGRSRISSTLPGMGAVASDEQDVAAHGVKARPVARAPATLVAQRQLVPKRSGPEDRGKLGPRRCARGQVLDSAGAHGAPPRAGTPKPIWRSSCAAGSPCSGESGG